MQRVPHEQGFELSRANTGLTPFQLHLLHRLDHLLIHAVPAAEEHWQIDLVGHALRHTLRECNQAGLASEATARLRTAGRRLGTVEGQEDIPDAPHSAGSYSN